MFNESNIQKQEFILGKGICRLPLFPFNKIKKIDSKNIREFAQIPIIQESMLLASPSLHEEVNKWLNGEITNPKRIIHIEQTLYKYISRTSTRCTPFGIFSTVSYIETSCNEEIDYEVLIKNSITKNTRLDTYYLQLLIDHFQNKKEWKPHLKYGINNSIYELGDYLRYFEVQKGNRDIYFELSKVSRTPYLETVLSFCSSPQTFIEIKNSCFKNEFSDDEITSFLYELIDARILLSELEFTLTNTNPLEKLIILLEKRVENIPLDEGSKKQISIVKGISEILNNRTKSINTKYNQIANSFKLLGINLTEKNLIHIDSYRSIKMPLHINQPLLDELIESKELLLKLTPPKIDIFKQFKADFYRRYGERTIPLLYALDPETGIGYNQRNEQGDYSSLLDNLEIPTDRLNTQNLSLTHIDIFLMNKILESKKKDSKEIYITQSDLDNYPIYSDQPDTMSVLFTSLYKRNKILLHDFSGSTSINLLNRFSHLDKKVNTLCLQIANYESNCNRDSIIAEIVHLPELKSGNLLLSNPLRDYEIPCVTTSEKSIEKTILLSDIQIRLVNGNKIELISTKHKKPILPKLSNTLNYDRNSINVFRFLSDFQFQDKIPYISFSWNNISNLFDFFPRVNYKNIILSPAYWVVNKIELIGNKSSNNFDNNLVNWKNTRKIPDTFYLSIDINNDNKLYIDITNDIGKEAFRKELIKSEKVILSEILINNDSPFTDKSKNCFNNEITLPVIRKPREINKLSKSDNSAIEYKEEIQSVFYPGSEWLSCKIYLGHKTADELLGNEIPNLVSILIQKKIISKWFFLRYFDEDFHLRLRFRISKPEYFSIVLREFNMVLKHYTENNIIHNIVVDTYKREVERYYSKCIVFCENLFCHDSFNVTNFLTHNFDEDQRWLFGVLSINEYLNNFRFSLSDKVKILELISSQFFLEFRGDKKLKVELDKKYRKYREKLQNYLKEKEISEKDINLMQLVKQGAENNKEQIKDILEYMDKNKSKNDLVDISLSIVHMFLNRLLISNHRKHEMVIYYLMWKHYKSEYAMQLKSIKK